MGERISGWVDEGRETISLPQGVPARPGINGPGEGTRDGTIVITPKPSSGMTDNNRL